MVTAQPQVSAGLFALRRTCCAALRLFVCALAASASFAFGQKSSTPDGRELFRSNCAACHGLDGRGGEHAPNIATSGPVQKKPDAELTTIIRKGIPLGGMPGFGTLLDQGQMSAVVSYLRTLQRDESQSTSSGNADQGSNIFFGAGRCTDCHMVNGRGGFLGADLSGYGETHSAAVIREWIVNPDKNADVRHSTATVITQDGRKLRGIVRNEDNFSLQLQTLDGEFQLLDKSALARFERESHSLMPPDYGKTLTKPQLDDLVAFLVKLKGGPSAAGSEDEP